MKFSKLVLLPLLALGLAACGPTDSSGTSNSTSGVEPSQPSVSESTQESSEDKPVATDWDEDLKSEMQSQYGFVVPFFTLPGEWGVDESQRLMFISDLEVNVTVESFFQTLALPMLEGGMVDSTYKYQLNLEDMPGTKAFVLSDVSVEETKTVLNSVIIWYFEPGAMGAGSLGAAMITGNVQPEVYDSRELKDAGIQSALEIAFPGVAVKVPSLEHLDGKLPYTSLYADKDYFQLMLGYCGTIENLEAIVSLFTDAGWICNPQGDADPADFYIGYDDPEVPEHQVIIRIMPDMAIAIVITPFAIA